MEGKYQYYVVPIWDKMVYKHAKKDKLFFLPANRNLIHSICNHQHLPIPKQAIRRIRQVKVFGEVLPF